MQLQLTGSGAGSVKPVAHDGKAKSLGVGGMQPELMGPASERHELDPGPAVFRVNLAPPCRAGLAVHRIMDLVRPVVRVQPKGKFDHPGILLDPSVDERDIPLAHQPVHELHGQTALGLGGQGHDDQPGSVLIKAVDRGELDTVRVDFFESADHAVLILRPNTGYGQQAAGLIDDHEQGIFMNNGQAITTVRDHLQSSPQSI